MRIAAWIKSQLVVEAAQGRLFPWLAVAFGAGIATYFAADREPIVWIVLLVAAVFVVAAWLARRSRYFALAALAAAAAAGFATASLKTARIEHGVLARPMFAVTLAGFIEVREERERSDRFVLRLDRFEPARVTTDTLPKLERVRLSVKKGTAPAVGSYVELKARLSPPFTALRPGGYDFARDIYFQRIGASGFVLGAIKPLAAPESGGWWLGYAVAINSMRDAIDARIRQTLSGDARAIATALLTGKRDAITSPVNEAMYVSGLGHILSISGYHMALVAGAVFFVLRALLALIPSLTVGFPIKKWAAAAALVAAAFYLLLSGAEVATQRSFLMTAVVLIGVMVDRRAITFRTLAVAAMVVMLLAPEAVVHPSFQMSFAATLGLVALMDRDRPLFSTADHSGAARAALWGAREVAILALASLIAGLATMPYAAFHFHRATPYGLVSNLLAMPIVSGVVMPAGLFGLLAMPFGFDGVFWRLMDLGIGWMISVAQWVAALPGAVGRVSAFGMLPLLLATLGLIVIALMRTPLRWCGALPILIGAALALVTPQPDVLIASDGQSVAVRGSDGKLRFMQTKKDAFAVKDWLAADADARGAGDATLAHGARCDAAGCAVRTANGGYVTIAQRLNAFADDCAKAAVIVTALPPPAGCKALVFGQDRLNETGSVALYVRDGAFVVDAVKPPGSSRPWARRAQATSDSNDAAVRQPTSRPTDATPSVDSLSPEDQ
ncbi:ComEC/Rec2 family competence protein [Bradyrhizobium sp. LHD-71]|nr:ComEC/Rec2 family competence protein [Bradyrhizobium sp. LHD-71]MDQ8728777.1 ComEC/Rec2 family competence protein [Bradyrhizobium sp. LHD-71]